MVVYLELCIHDWESSLQHYTRDPPHQFSEICRNNDGQVNKGYTTEKVVTFHLQWEMGFHINISMSFYTVDSTSLKNLNKKIVVTSIRLSINFHGFSFEYIENFMDSGLSKYSLVI